MQWEWSSMAGCHIQSAEEEERGHAENVMVAIAANGSDDAHESLSQIAFQKTESRSDMKWFN